MWLRIIPVCLLLGVGIGLLLGVLGVDLGPPAGPVALAIAWLCGLYLALGAQAMGYRLGGWLVGSPIPRAKRRGWRQRHQRPRHPQPVLVLALLTMGVAGSRPATATVA